MFRVGDRLRASDFDREHHGLQEVEITEINLESGVYHWEAPHPYFGGRIHSGYFFSEAQQEFQFTGWNQEALKFFEGHMIREERMGCGASATWICLTNRDYLPKSGDSFLKNHNGEIKLA